MDTFDKATQYAVLIQQKIAELLEEDGEIDRADLMNGENNLTAFFYALATMVPTNLYNSLTNDNTDVLGFTHIANRLAAQVGTEIAIAEYQEKQKGQHKDAGGDKN
jgi:hypothetical protein